MDVLATGSCHVMPPDLAETVAEGVSKELRSPLKTLVTGELGPLGIEGQAGTLFATFDGAAVAVVPLALYKRLVSAAVTTKSAALPPASASPRAKPHGLSTIERDPEVAEFIQSRCRGGVTIEQIRDACRNSFGEDRTPSRTRINRFRDRLRKCR